MPLADQTPELIEKLDRLQAELVELAYSLECKGRIDAADVAVMTSTRVAEMRAEISGKECLQMRRLLSRG
jgi:hypothetical protein